MLAEVTVVFVDVRGFTTLSEQLPPMEIAARLNRFYSLATQLVFELDGTLDKMVGDQVMAFFGAPFRPADHPQRAVQTAVRIVSSLESLAEDPGSLRVGAGVATGQVFMGNVGEGEVKDFTVIGDPVNTAARLQGAALPGEVLVAEDTYQRVSHQFPDAAHRALELKGKAGEAAIRVLRSGNTQV
ncbi:MAG: hypothetical protein BZY88_00710 [SAR202 cluster bacterium Io17-Chloro-G9]|nr:MAG: hypothetical protein BZY88_00710 [SAR202 cluster bacterium Io17-Chloro-G9]